MGKRWTKAPKKLERRCVMVEVYGDTGTGRTSFALTAPGPIGLIHASEKIEGIVQRFADKEVLLHDFGGVFKGDERTIAKQASPIVKEMKSAWRDALDTLGTAVLDTHTEAWEIMRLARFGTLTPKGKVAHLYGPLNAEWRSMLKQFRQQDTTNAVIIGQTKDEYRNDKQTGRTVRAGQKEVPFMADVIVRMSRTMDGEFTATIEKGWYNAYAEGVELMDDDATFAMVMSVITGEDPEKWGG